VRTEARLAETLVRLGLVASRVSFRATAGPYRIDRADLHTNV
jgi:hypothetical protein